MSAAAGVDYLDKDLKTYLKYSKQKRLESEEANVFGFLFTRFEKTGTRDWREPTVEWFLSYILTEFAVTPHTIRQGRNAIMITSAYQTVVEKLVCSGTIPSAFVTTSANTCPLENAQIRGLPA